MLRDDLPVKLKEAMKARETDVVNTVRLMIASMKDKDIDARGKGNEKATETELLSMLQNMIKQRNDSIKIYSEAGRQELADKEQVEITIIEKFLPKQMGTDEVENAIKSIIAEIKAESMKDMGKVMAELRAKYAGQMDFGKASGSIKALLS